MPATITITLDASSYEDAIAMLEQIKKDITHCFQNGKGGQANGDQYRFTMDGDLEGKRDELEEEEENHTFPFTATGEITVLGTYQEAQDEAYQFLKDLRLNKQDNNIMGYSVENIRFLKVEQQNQEEKKEESAQGQQHEKQREREDV